MEKMCGYERPSARNVVDGLGGRTNGMPREDGYDITVASEIMAVLCLASDITDLKERLSKIIIGYTYGKVSEQKPVTAGDLHAEGAMTALLKDALKPNLFRHWNMFRQSFMVDHSQTSLMDVTP